MANCLVTTLTEQVNNDNILAPDEFVIKVNHINSSITSAARWISFTFREVSNIRIDNTGGTSYSFTDVNGNNIGSSVDFAVNTAKTLFFPNPAEGASYRAIVSKKYALANMNTQEVGATQYDFFEFDLGDLRYCNYLSDFRFMCHKVYGDISDISFISTMIYLQIGRTGITGDIANLARMTNILHFRAIFSDVYGDIAVFSQIPTLRTIELTGTLEIYGNIEAFENHTSINSLSFPQVYGHPSVSGDIANLSGCSSLGSISAINESNIYGDISVFGDLDSIWYIALQGTGVYGDVAVFAGKDAMQTINLGNSTSGTYLGPADDKVYGNISSFANLSHLNQLVLTNSGVTGDVGTLTGLDRLGSILLTNTAVTGEIGDFNATAMPSLSLLDIGNCAGIGGSITDWNFPSSIQTLNIYGTGITGDIGAALENCTSLAAIDFHNTDVTGDVTKIYIGTSIKTGVASSCPNLYGDLSQLPADFYYFTSNGRSGGAYSWAAVNSRPSTSTVVCFDNVYFGEDLEKMLINQANCVPSYATTTPLQKRMYVWGLNTSATTMSAECRTACETLGQAGYSVYINGVLVVGLPL